MQESFILDGAIRIDKDNDGLFRIGIMGAPKSGKTWAALTFPNPVVLDFDNNLRGFSEVYTDKVIHKVPFYDAKFCDTLGRRAEKPGAPPNQRDAVRVWLSKNAGKFTPDMTLILDSWTRLQDGFDKQQELEPKHTKNGQVDDFDFWLKKQEFSRDVLTWLESCNCNVVVTFHETGERNADGKLTGKLKPVMDGRFADKLQGYFTDWFRQHSIEEEIKNAQGVVVEKRPHWLWQVKSDNIANCGTSLRTLDIRAAKGFVKAHYDSLIK